jgi:glycosyltransferase involved in cell wall biosynthesis
MKENFITGQWYDAVIPHFFDPDDYTFETKKDDYFIYFGRLIQRKGIHIAADICKRIGAKLLIAGQPMWPDDIEKSLKHVGCLYPHVEYLGVLTEKELDKYVSKARASFVPSLYMEPFGLVVVESLLSGTPVITTDWGSFPEIVKQGEVGYRCRTADDFIWACHNVDKLDPKECRDYAIRNYSMRRIGLCYEEYFTKISDLSNGGWYAQHPERTNLDWLRRY